MKDLSIEYRDGKFVSLVIDGVEMKEVTSIQFSHAVGQDVPTVTISGHVVSSNWKNDQKLVQVDKQTTWHDEVNWQDEVKRIMNERNHFKCNDIK